MAAELAEIERPGAALEFAAGCLMAAFRLGAAEPATLVRLGRWGVAGCAGLYAAIVAALGVRMVLLNGAAPAAETLFAPMAVVGAYAFLYLVAAWAVLTRRKAVFAAASAALIIILVQGLLGRSLTEVSGAGAPDPAFLAALALEQTGVLCATILGALALWLLDPPSVEPRTGVRP
jgi:hypothetical protein